MTDLNKYYFPKYIDDLAHLAAPIRKTLSPLASYLVNKKLITHEDTILDYGCGYGKDVELLSDKGFNIDGYDAYYFPDLPKKKYSVVLCNYVLNTLSKRSDRSFLLQHCWELTTDKLFVAAHHHLFSRIECRALLHISTGVIANVNRQQNYWLSEKKGTPVKIYAPEEAKYTIEQIMNSGWVAPDKCSIGGYCTHFDFKYKEKNYRNNDFWAGKRYYRLKSSKPNLPGKDGLVKSVYLGISGEPFSPKYLWAQRGLLRREAIKRVKFHCNDFSYLHEFFGNRSWDFLNPSWRPNPDPLGHPLPSGKPKRLVFAPRGF